MIRLTFIRRALLVMCFGAMMGSPVFAQGSASRGQLLYDTHCIACHNAQVHWRDQRLATDWASLTTWVRRWQASVYLDWTDQDVADVALHLNALYYRFPQRGGSTTLGLMRAVSVGNPSRWQAHAEAGRFRTTIRVVFDP